MNKIRVIIFLGLCWLIFPAWGWNDTGHRVIAAIAYPRLSPHAKQQVDALTRQLFYSNDGYQRFLKAATWPDDIRAKGNNLYNNWHYINLPWSIDGTPTFAPAKTNLQSALKQSLLVLSNQDHDQHLRLLMLVMLIHLTGDAHQPLHCINRFSRHYPHGDAGGNWFPINMAHVKNLHAFWDQGLGLFNPPGMRYAAYQNYIAALANTFTSEYPPNFFGQQVTDLKPDDWIHDSYELAINSVYKPLQKNQSQDLPKFQKLSNQYVMTGRQLVAKQSALAGYRLAAILNALF